jgi:hypothetical protein
MGLRLGPKSPKCGKLGYTEKPQYNKSEGTKDFVLYSRGFVITGDFYYEINYRGLKIKFFIAGILLLKGLLYRGFSASCSSQ